MQIICKSYSNSTFSLGSPVYLTIFSTGSLSTFMALAISSSRSALPEASPSLLPISYIFNTSFYFLLTYFHCNHIIIIKTGFLSSKILFAHRWRLISDRLENIVRSPEASNKCPARKFRPCRMAGLIL